MDDAELLDRLTWWRTVDGERRAQNLGKKDQNEHRPRSIREIFNTDIKKGLRRHKRQSRVVDLWREILPAELAKHCQLVSLLRGELKIRVEAGVYMFEMQSVCQALLEQLQRDCPGAGIDSIKLVSCETLKEPNENGPQKKVKQ